MPAADEQREMSGAAILVECLVRQGVEFVFGYPGGAVLPIYDELFADERLRHILVRHEAGAAHAAEGYARSTGKCGVALATSGPGATNLVTPIADAMLDCSDRGSIVLDPFGGSGSTCFLRSNFRPSRCGRRSREPARR